MDALKYQHEKMPFHLVRDESYMFFHRTLSKASEERLDYKERRVVDYKYPNLDTQPESIIALPHLQN